MSIEGLSQCRAIFFDYGGTLDSDGERWPDRFYALYNAAALHVPPEEIKRAFYYAEERCYDDPAVTALGLRALMEAHVRRQFEALSYNDREKQQVLVDGFCATSEQFMSRSAPLLARAKERYRLGIISNFYGNLGAVLEEAGLLTYFDVVIDSNRVGVQKPDPEIFRCALAQLGLAPHQVIFVGDSYERDILPSKELGMKTIWLKRPNTGTADGKECDACIGSLVELEALIV